MKNFTLLALLIIVFSWQINAQTTLYLTTSGGSFPTEKWVDITDGPNGTGNVLWAQGNGTYGDSQGLVTDASFTVTNGTTYYINCYDRYDDGWDGTTYEIRTAPLGGGVLVANNGGASPNDGNDVDLTSSWEVMDDERESSEAFSYTPPACIQPSGLTAGSIGTTSVDLNWVENGTATTWDIEWGTAGFTPTGTPTIAGTSTKPYNLTGLTAQTSYDFYVRAACGGGNGNSVWVGPYTFTTACNAYPVPFYENFSSTSTTQNCWTVIDNNNDGDMWDMDYTSSVLAGDEVAVLYTDYNAGNNDDYLITPTLTLTGNERLRFSYRVQSGGEPNDLQVTLSTTGIGTSNFTTTLMPLTTLSNTTYQEQIINLTAYTGNVNIAFHVPNGGLDGWRLYLDSVVVEAVPSCPDPTALTVSNVTSTTADLNWTEMGTATMWDIEWDTAGFTPTGTPTIAGTSTKPYNLTGLTAQTSYDFYVRAACGGGNGNSNWVGPFTFATACSAFLAPYLEEFNTNALPNCWTEGGDNLWEYGSVSGTSPSGFADYGAANVADHSIAGNGTFIGMDGSNNSAGDVSTLYSPFIDASPLTTPHLSYWVFSNNTNDAAQNKLIVELFDGANWNVVDSIQANLGTNWVEFDTDLSVFTITGDVQVRFKVAGDTTSGVSPYYNDILIDDVRIYEPLTNDVAVISIESSASAGCGLASETVTVKVKNFGLNAETGFDVVYTLNGTPITPETIGGTVLPGDTITYTFTTLANMSTPNTYIVDAYTLLTTDGNNANDTLKGWSVEHIAPSLTYNDSAAISNSISSGTNSIICTNGLVQNMLGGCYQLSALVIDSLLHTWNSDLDIWLISPAGDTLEVSTDNGGSTDNYINVMFTDTVMNYITGQNPVPGNYHTEDSIGLAKFNGTDPNGAWTLRVIDDTGGDDGMLYKWHLEFTDYSFAVNLGGDTTLCPKQAILIDAGAGNYSYAWSTGDSAQAVVIDSTKMGGLGTYPIYVTVTDTLTGCAVTDTINITFDVCADVSNNADDVNMNVYPNPNNGTFTINVVSNEINKLSVKVVNLQGQEVYSSAAEVVTANYRETVDLDRSAPGIYFITITTNKGILSQRIIVQ